MRKKRGEEDNFQMLTVLLNQRSMIKKDKQLTKVESLALQACVGAFRFFCLLTLMAGSCGGGRDKKISRK